MTNSPLKMRIALFFTITFALFATAVVAKTSRNPSIKIPSYNSSTLFVAVTDFLDDDRFAVSLRERNSIILTGIQVIESNNTRRECAVPCSSGSFAIRRLSAKSVLIPYDNRNENGEIQVKLMLLNTVNCKYTYVYDNALPSRHRFFTSKNSTDERFTLLMSGTEYCRGHLWCRLSFDPMFREFEPLDFEFDFPSIEITVIEPATTFDADLFTVGFVDDDGTLRVRLYDLSVDRTGPLYKELLTIAGYHTKMQILGKSYYDHLAMPWYHVVSSGLSYCWRSILANGNFVHCSRFREDGRLMFNQTIVYPNTMRLLQVTTIPNGLVLISYELYGVFDLDVKRNRSSVQVAVITRDFESVKCEDCSTDGLLGNELMRIKHRQYNTKCQESQHASWGIRTDDGGLIAVRYMCVNAGNVFGVINID